MPTIHPEAEALKEAGNKLVGKKKYAEALQKYKDAVSIDPSRAAYHSNMAFCYQKLGEQRNFEEAARKSIQADPSFVRGYQRLATALTTIWAYEEALETANKGLEMDPTNQDLQHTQSMLEGILHMRGTMMHHHVLSAKPPTVPFFGGLRWNQRVSKIPADSLYGSLDRKILPPLAETLAKQLRSGKYDGAAFPVAEAFFTGDIRIEWVNQDSDFVLNAYLTDQVDPGPIVSVMMKLLEVMRPDGRKQHAVRMRMLTNQNPTYDELIPTDVYHSLRMILLQRFFREKAASLVGEDGDIQVLELMISQVTTHFLELGLYQDAADLKLVLSDVCVNMGSSAKNTYAAVHLGEALEAAENYTDAAKVYMEVANGRLFPSYPDCPEIRARTYAGLAFKRSKDYVQAEEQYVAALRSQGTRWTWKNGDDTDVGNTLNNMMIYYEIVHRAVQTRQLVDEEHRIIEGACLLLVGLLSIAGYRGNGGCTLFRDGYKIFQGYLKKEFKTPKKAMRAIVAAFSAPNIHEYRKVLFACSEYKNITILMPYITDSYRTSLSKETAKAREGAREQLRQQHL